jgi:bifunctional UDP-N-acetylglucosamine pyrophosphorylase/glucosamine-1-phosphate N-acetyltransferase
VHKHVTKIGEKAFVGSNSTLVAPVEIAGHTYIAAGSVITKTVPEDALAIGRARQENKEGYAKRLHHKQ